MGFRISMSGFMQTEWFGRIWVQWVSIVKHGGFGWENLLGIAVFVVGVPEIYRGLKTGVLENIPTLRGDRHQTPIRFYISLFFIVITTLGAGGLALGLLPGPHQ